jgi:hypothetical protein
MGFWGCHDSPRQLLQARRAPATGSWARTRGPSPPSPGRDARPGQERRDWRGAALRGRRGARGRRGDPGGLGAAGAQGQQREQQRGQREQEQRRRLAAELHDAARSLCASRRAERRRTSAQRSGRLLRCPPGDWGRGDWQPRRRRGGRGAGASAAPGGTALPTVLCGVAARHPPARGPARGLSSARSDPCTHPPTHSVSHPSRPSTPPSDSLMPCTFLRFILSICPRTQAYIHTCTQAGTSLSRLHRAGLCTSCWTIIIR